MKEQLKNKACVYFHQGWTDIVMCMGLINYYASIYSEITIIIREDAKYMVDYYTKGLSNVIVLYITTDNGRFYGTIATNSTDINVQYYNNTILIPNDFDIMFHAEHDKFRKDNYQYKWYETSTRQNNKHFSELFYILYGIDFNNRIESFNVERDLELEEEQYNKFIIENGVDYIIYHDDEENDKHGTHHVSTKIDLNEKRDKTTCVNLNKISNVFFDYIKIIQNASEIHLVDSIWGCLLYQLDAKYNILNGKEVNLYCKRGHDDLFTKPITLNNWKLIK